MADPEKGPGKPGPPLFLDHTETSPPLSKGLDNRPPPPHLFTLTLSYGTVVQTNTFICEQNPIVLDSKLLRSAFMQKHLISKILLDKIENILEVKEINN